MGARRNILRKVYPLFVVLLALLSSCTTVYAAGQQSDPRPLYQLPPGQHVGAIVGFERYPSFLEQKVGEAWQETMEAGMKIGRVQLDWAGLEPTRGVYDRGALVDQLSRMRADGLAPFVSIIVVDSEGLVLPEFLSDETSPTGVAGGVSLDHRNVQRRFRALLEWTVPLISDYGGWALSISNEPESYFEEYPGEIPRVLSFFQSAIDQIHQIDDSLAVTVTLTSSLVDGPRWYYDELMGMLDFASYNYYPLFINRNLEFELREPLETVVHRHVDALVAGARGRPVVFQELGAPASDKATNVIGSSPARQAEFFSLFFDEMGRTPEIRAAYVFQLVDWSEPLSRLLTNPLRTEGFVPLADSMDEWLTTVGLLTYPEGEKRPAYREFLEAVSGVGE